MKTKTIIPRGNRGFMLLEVLISVLIFSLGVMALIGLQARAIGSSVSSEARAEAMYLVNTYIGEMWAAGVGVVANAEDTFQQGGSFYSAWRNRVIEKMPGADMAAPSGGDNPEVVITLLPHDPAIPTTPVHVTITMHWQEIGSQGAAGETVTHSYSQQNTISGNPLPGATPATPTP